MCALPGVFCAGEMLDWEAPTGSYLLTACFATGRAAGLGTLRWLQEHQSETEPLRKALMKPQIFLLLSATFAVQFLTSFLGDLGVLAVRFLQNDHSQRTLTSPSTCLNSLSPVMSSALRSFASAAAKQSA